MLNMDCLFEWIACLKSPSAPGDLGCQFKVSSKNFFSRTAKPDIFKLIFPNTVIFNYKPATFCNYGYIIVSQFIVMVDKSTGCDACTAGEGFILNTPFISTNH